MRFLRKAGIRPGQEVLIYGASGSVGTFAIQITKLSDSTVSGVCSTGNFEMVKGLGATQVFDYKTQDFTLLSGRFDIVFDAVGKANRSYCRQMLRPGGRFVTVNSLLTGGSGGELEEIKEFIQKGTLKTIIDREYTLAKSLTRTPMWSSFIKKGIWLSGSSQ
jgi:NADPH:quinone reductase-like Zn-dependent oxidoreductase